MVQKQHYAHKRSGHELRWPLHAKQQNTKQELLSIFQNACCSEALQQLADLTAYKLELYGEIF